MSEPLSGDLERKALELLPWYVNGTLEGWERELVHRQVTASLTARKELERLRRLQELIRHDDAEAIATDRAFESLMSRIRASETMATTADSRKFAWLAMAASLMAAATALAWWWAAAPPTEPVRYETLTSQPLTDSIGQLRVVFEPGVGEPERKALLARHGLTPVEPPTAEGVYTLRLSGTANPEAIAAALREDSRIRLVTSPPPIEAP